MVIAALGVNYDYRHLGGSVANELIEHLVTFGHKVAQDRFGTGLLLIQGKVHSRNIPSQLLMERHNLEPQGVPTGDYQLWQRLSVRAR